MAYQSKTDDELKQIAKDLLAGHVFTDRHVPPDDDRTLMCVFMVMALGGRDVVDQMRKDNITMVYEYLDKAGPRSINGFPSFFSCQMLDATDNDKMFGYYERYKVAQESV